MPVKNEEKFLAKTLDSILCQTEKRFELVIIDDSSTDNTPQIIKNYKMRDSRIVHLTNRGDGVIDALKQAYLYSKGELLTRQDADDLMPPYKIEELKNILLSCGPGAVATGRVKYFSDHKLGEGFVNYANWLNQLCEKNSHKDQLFKECVIASSNWLMYRSDVEKISGFKDMQYPEDYFLVFKVFEYNLKICCSQKVTHYWRDHPERASRVSPLYKDQKFFSLKIKFFIKFYGTQNVVLWGAGPTGKQLAKELQKQGVNFFWLTNNLKKIGQTIYGVTLEEYKALEEKNQAKLILSVTQRGALEKIKNYLAEIGFEHYFEF